MSQHPHQAIPLREGTVITIMGGSVNIHIHYVLIYADQQEA